MAGRVSNLIFIDRLFAPAYWVCSWILPLFFSKTEGKNKLVIKFFGMGSIVRMASTLKDAELEQANTELITLERNREICQLLGIKAHYIRLNNVFLLLSDLTKVLLMVWQMKNTKIIDLERTSYLSSIFRLLLSLGKSCSSFTFENNNRTTRKQTFVSLKEKSIIQALAEILQLKLKPKQSMQRTAFQKNKIVINVNAGEYLPQRKYP